MRGIPVNKRLAVAMGGSIGSHLLLIVVLAWLLSSAVEPSLDDRVLVLTLQSSALDDVADVDSPIDQHTVDRQVVGEPSSVPDQQAGVDQASAIEVTAQDSSTKPLVAEAVPEPNPEPIIESNPAPAAKRLAELPPPEFKPESVPAKATGEQSLASASPTTDNPTPSEPSQAEPSSQLLTIEHSEQQIALVEAVPASEMREVDFATPAEALPNPLPNLLLEPEVTAQSDPQPAVSMSGNQLAMLDRRFKKWTEDFDPTKPTMNWQHKGQQYSASFTRLPAADDMEMEQVVVEVVTEQNGKRLSTNMRMKKLAFSNYAQFIHRWDPRVMIHDDELDGRFHSNSKISLAYERSVRPVFSGKVTTSSRQVAITDGRGRARSSARRKIFRGGLETGVKKILLPPRALPFPEQAETNAQANSHQTEVLESDHIHQFSEETWIRFNPDGSFNWQTANDSVPKRSELASTESTYLIGAKGKPLYVEGIVNGRVLVYSPERIVIEGDLVYAKSPGSGDGSSDMDDYLGLVSDRNVEIAKPKVTGPGDLNIHASIYAKRRFVVKRFSSRHQGTLYIYGSLTAGSLTATEPRYGTRIEFDKRLEHSRAPGFPTTDRYEVASWDETWRAESTAVD